MKHKNEKGLPPIIGLQDGGKLKYLTEKKLKEDPELLDKYKYFLISIATLEKGPMYTTVRASTLELGASKAEYALSLYIPGCGVYTNSYYHKLKIDTVHKRYAFMPMIYQYLNSDSFSRLNAYEEGFDEDETPQLGNFYMKIDSRKIEINPPEIYDGEYDLRDLFEEIDIVTISDSVFYNHMPQYMCIINKEEYELIENRTRYDTEIYILSMMQKLKASYIVIPLIGYETVYLLSYYQLYQLSSINYLCIYIRDGSMLDNYKEIDTAEDFDENEYSYSYQAQVANGITGILEWVIACTNIIQNLYLCFQGNDVPSRAMDGFIRFRINDSPDMLTIRLPRKLFPNLPLFYILDKIIC